MTIQSDTVYFKVPFINCNVPVPFFSRADLAEWSDDIQTVSSRYPEQFAKNVELIKSVATVALTALVAFITTPIWLTGILFGTSTLGPGVWVALPFMGLSLWQLCERVVDAFHRQVPAPLGSLAADWTRPAERVSAAPPMSVRFASTHHGDFGGESSYGAAAAASGAFPRATASFGDDVSHRGPWSSANPHG